MRRAITLLAVIATVTGVANATPAFARPKPQNRNIPCEGPPPTSDVVSSRQGGVNLQLPGFGLGADRARVTSRTDVIINAEGREGWFDLDLYAKACHAIVQTWPNNPTKQLELMFEFRERLRKTASAAAAPERELAQGEAGVQALLAAAFATPAETPPAPSPSTRATAPLPRPSTPPITFNVSATGSDDQALPAHIDNNPLFNPFLEAAQQGERRQPSSPPAPPAPKRPAPPAADRSANNGCFGNACQGWGNGLDQQMDQTRSYAAPTVTTTVRSSMTSSSSCVPVIGSTIAVRVGNGMMLLGPPPMTTSTVRA